LTLSVVLSARAEAQVDALIAHYERLGRGSASRNLLSALEVAATRIQASPLSGLPTPRPYPTLSRPGRLWVQVRPYWIAYTISDPIVIIAVIYDTANIPRRL
jgi:plasmid stabilization system protein ParE